MKAKERKKVVVQNVKETPNLTLPNKSLKVETLYEISFDEVFPCKDNPKIHNDNSALKLSIIENGYVNPILVDEDNVILAGHSRYFTLKELCYEKIPHIVKIIGLPESQKQKYRLVDNTTSGLGSSLDLDVIKRDFDIDWLMLHGVDLFRESKKNVSEAIINRVDIDVNREFDFVLVLCKTFTDFTNLEEKLELQKVKVPKNKRIGTCRVIHAEDLIGKLK